MEPSSRPDDERRRPRIVFALMSAVAPVAAVDELAMALAPHTVLVHHDFSQQPDFPLSAPNVVFVPEPMRTGWAVFGFVEGIFHTLRHACRELEFDYLQLLSPSCLPIKSMAHFEAHVGGPEEAHFDCIDLLADRDALMSVGYRAFTPEASLRHRVARRLSMEYFGPEHDRRDEAGIWLRSGGRAGVLPLAARGLVHALSHPAIGRHPFGEDLRPYYGSAWFGARRRVVEALVDEFAKPQLRDYFSRLRIAEEFLLPTLLMQAAGRSRGPSNHYVHRFDEAHAGLLQEQDLNLLREQPAFFARKFPVDVEAPVRRRVIQALCQDDARAAAPPASTRAASPRPLDVHPGERALHAATLGVKRA
ncbi:hypothetical protein [Ramlibacter rhizophilus]|uniref:Uncharacterized protein n=1 Tax=Ramlibacter rhizophilus TaxID=1781167 RepID=A0A4Z0BCG1_9BURK|nr:hypothetical protein [Ramlibacter rhizophilus]TFY96400.1 hypothetical protein EZ242_20330 [Ramlibacter rhizophilus]